MSTTVNGGTLYVVATPIGNLGDMTHRAIDILRGVDLIACEDTRRTRTLLAYYSAHTPTTSYHDHNKVAKTPNLLKTLRGGSSIALVSDAGTPGISDPAFYLVRAAIEDGINVTPIPGASAALAALVASGLPTDSYLFEGFLPRQKGRVKRLKALVKEERTIILFEAPHRLLRTLEDLRATLGNRRVAVGRELTKKFEQFIRGQLSDIIDYFSKTSPKGEFVLVVSGRGKEK